MARWLYDESAVRNYVDIDLLVSRGDSGVTENVLTAAGFESSGMEIALPHGRRPHANTWIRNRDGLMVDVHDTLPGLGVSAESAWAILGVGTGTILVGGAEVEMLNEPARALLVALHAGHHGVADSQAVEDLRRALTQLPDDTWGQALVLANQLGAAPGFAAGLGLFGEGRYQAERLGLPVVTSIETILRANSAPELALSLDWLLRARGFRVRCRLIARRLAPLPSILRGRSRLARSGTAGLVTAYALQPVWLAGHAVPAMRAWLGALSETRKTSSSQRDKAEKPLV